MMKEVKLNFRLTLQLVSKLDEIRRHEPDIPTRAEMLRRLIEERAAGKGR